MIRKDYIKKILKINGLSERSNEDDIRSVLLYAKCENVDHAIEALRDAQIGQNDDICGLQKAPAKCNVLLADKRLSPDMIKNLLGVDMEISYEELERARAARRSVSTIQIASIFIISFLLALITICLLMWYYEVAFFHPSVCAFC